jgi:hypothetical protein
MPPAKAAWRRDRQSRIPTEVFSWRNLPKVCGGSGRTRLKTNFGGPQRAGIAMIYGFLTLLIEFKRAQSSIISSS